MIVRRTALVLNVPRTFRNRKVMITKPRSVANGVDLVLSSGFLAFAKHAGFLKAVDEVDLEVTGVMGTSAGAYVGSLYCAGYTAENIVEELCGIPPVQLLKPNLRFWNGFLLLEDVVNRLHEILPPTFESLDKELAVGVINAQGHHQIIDSGPLPEAVAASGAVPIMFAPVGIPGRSEGPFRDGGVKDRTGLRQWRERRRNQQNGVKKSTAQVPDAIVHLIARSLPFGGVDKVRETGERRVTLFQSNKSGRNIFSLGDYQNEMIETYNRLTPSISEAQKRIHRKMRIS
eukprot:g804.t1